MNSRNELQVLQDNYHDSHDKKVRAYHRKVFFHVGKKLCDRKLDFALHKWKMAIFSDAELAKMRWISELTANAKLILMQTKTGRRSSEQLVDIECCIEEMFPQLFSERGEKSKFKATRRDNKIPDRRQTMKLDKQAMSLLAQSIELQTFEKGYVLFQQGDLADCMYGVLTGEIDIYAHDFNIKGGRRRESVVHGRIDEPVAANKAVSQRKNFLGKSVRSLGRGSILGELGLSSDSAERSASAVISARADLICIKKKVYTTCFQAFHTKLKNRYRRIDALAKLHFFNDWQESRLGHLFYPMQEVLMRRGATIVQQGALARGMYILISGTAVRKWKGNGIWIETSWASDGAIFGFEEIIALLLRREYLAEKYIPSETVTITSNMATLLFLPRDAFSSILGRFANTHTLAKMINAFEQREKIVFEAQKLRSKVADLNRDAMRVHVSAGKSSLPSFRTIKSEKYFDSCHRAKIHVPNLKPLCGRGKLRLSLIPKNISKRVKESTLLHYMQTQSKGLQIDKKGMATTTDLQESLMLSKFDLSRISLQESEAIGYKKKSKFEGYQSKMSSVHQQLDKLSIQRPPRLAQRPADRERATYLTEKRSKWLKVAQRGKKHSRRRRRKVRLLDEFDDRIDRLIYSDGAVIGRNVRRL